MKKIEKAKQEKEASVEKETHVIQLEAPSETEKGSNITLEKAQEGVFTITSASTFRKLGKELGENEEELVGLALKRKNLEKTKSLDEYGGMFAGVDDELAENERRWNEIEWKDGEESAKVVTSTMGVPASKEEGNLGKIEASSLEIAEKALKDLKVEAYSINDM